MPAETLSQETIWAALAEIADPEMPVSITRLGIVRSVEVEAGRVKVHAKPTFMGCPALAMIQSRIVERLQALEGVSAVQVEWVLTPGWSPRQISAPGQADLRELGVSMPARAKGQASVCPYCGSSNTVVESLFGPTLCRSISYCRNCRSSFEQLKDVASSE
jgi:ring-1,2-phenylacetyl-CoA epoxidase subunit PaaD